MSRTSGGRKVVARLALVVLLAAVVSAAVPQYAYAWCETYSAGGDTCAVCQSLFYSDGEICHTWAYACAGTNGEAFASGMECT